MAQDGTVPSDLYQHVYSFLVENKFAKAAKEFLKQAKVKPQDQNEERLMDIFNFWVKSPETKKRKAVTSGPAAVNGPSAKKAKKDAVSSSSEDSSSEEEAAAPAKKVVQGTEPLPESGCCLFVVQKPAAVKAAVQPAAAARKKDTSSSSEESDSDEEPAKAPATGELKQEVSRGVDRHWFHDSITIIMSVIKLNSISRLYHIYFVHIY
uniref:LisH domain-containing protein n=1 Tax=Cyprinus carpio TaxID=7962 RepID=A0A8C2C8T6_CYPCA